MGGFLTKPVTDKTVTDGVLTVCARECLYCTASMQGWREDMEDMMSVIPNFNNDSSYLAVFDGHGGKEVSSYCSAHLPDFIKDNKKYQEGDIAGGLCEAFMDIDKELLTDEAVKEMKTVTQQMEEEEEETDEDEVHKLTEEAHMPLDKVLEACIEDKKLLKYLVNLSNRTEQGEGEEEKEEEEEEEELEEEEETGTRSRIYTQFIKELSLQYKPALNELQSMIGDESSSSSDEDTTTVRKRKREDGDEDDNVDSKKIKIDPPNSVDSVDPVDPVDSNDHDSEGYESGTTANICIISHDTLYVANVGDSRCVLSHNGEAVDLSLDHKPVDPLEKERIERAGGHIDDDLRVNGGLNMSRAIGDHMYKMNDSLPLEDQMISGYPDIHKRLLQPQDEFLVLASDGIWNCLDSQNVVDFIRNRLLRVNNRTQLSVILEELCDSCLADDIDNDGTGCDNMAIILALLKPLDKLFHK